MFKRLALAASLVASLGAALWPRAASAEDLTFSAPVTGMGNWLFEGPLHVEDGKFQEFFTSGNARLQVWGSVNGDQVTIGGQVKVTGFFEQGSTFRIEGQFRNEKFTGNFVEMLNYGQNLHGQITMTRPVAQTAPAAPAPAQQAVLQPQAQPATPPAPQTTQVAPAAPTPQSLEPKLSGVQRQGVQQQLTVLGFYDKAANGTFGASTRDAIRKFQRAHDLAPTGYLDADQIRLLKEAAATKEKEIAAANAQQAEEQATAKKLADEKAAQEKAEADRKAAEDQSRALTAQVEADRKALEAQKAELKRQQDELAKSQQQAEASKGTQAAPGAAAAAPATQQQATAGAPATQQQATATTTPAKTPAAPATEAAPGPPADFSAVLATLQPIDEIYVATRPAKIRSAPNVASARVGTLNEGDKIQVLGRLPGQDWFLVARDDQPIGYVVANQLASQADATRATPGAAATTGQPTATAQSAQSATQPATQQAALPPELANLDYGSYHALVIGNDLYRSLPHLGTAVGDAEAVAKELEHDYHFNVRLLTNATEEDIIGALTDMRRELQWNDNLLIYYAGHGWYDQDAEQGYWLPVDATEDNQAHWISNADITNALKALRAKHILVVADSCYSGTLARDANISLRGVDYIERIVKKKARTVLTSGGLEPVLDAGGQGHSVFAHAFLEALADNDGVIDGQELFRRLRDPVVANAPQTPEYGEIRGAGHDGGDFIFVRR
jgi:peptidoglycan hydrolase-like protein with peptidoglycan-binding domain